MQVRVNVQKIAGALYGSSDEVPGLHVGGTSMANLAASVERGIVFLFAENRKQAVTAKVLRSERTGMEVEIAVH